MVRLFSILVFCFSLSAHADFFGFGTKDGYQSKIPGLVEKLKSTEVAATPAYEDSFNQTVKSIENTIEEEKLFCAGEAADVKGRVMPKEQKQLCFRELKTIYLEAIDTIFNIKKKYLGVIHTHQMEKLSEIQKKQNSDIGKSF